MPDFKPGQYVTLHLHDCVIGSGHRRVLTLAEDGKRVSLFYPATCREFKILRTEYDAALRSKIFLSSPKGLWWRIKANSELCMVHGIDFDLPETLRALELLNDP